MKIVRLIKLILQNQNQKEVCKNIIIIGIYYNVDVYLFVLSSRTKMTLLYIQVVILYFYNLTDGTLCKIYFF